MENGDKFSMSKADEAKIKAIFNQALDEKRTMDLETHRAHHNFLAVLINEHETRRQRYEQLMRSVLGWVIIGALAAVGTAVYNFFFQGGA